VLILPAEPPRWPAVARWPLPTLLDEHWISLNAGAAMLQAQQQAAMAAGRPLKLRMQVRSFDAVGHMVASGLGHRGLPQGPRHCRSCGR
jgi:DNA-binding transcriptional LysR family regulator